MPREPTAAHTLTIRETEIPKLGLGTWELEGEDCAEAVRHALEIGYRHIDTAAAYGNEREVGRGFADSGVARDEVWITTKVWREMAEPKRVRRSAERSLKSLGVDRIDLLLLHWPSDPPLAATMGALSALRDEGLVREIGVSNFPSALLAEALELAPVFADQVEFHPYLGQPALLAMARERDLTLTAYSPFAHGRLLSDATLRQVADEQGRSPAQVALRWLFDQPNVSAVPKASSADKREANLAVFDFELSDAQRGAIAGLERGERVIDPSFAPTWD